MKKLIQSLSLSVIFSLLAITSVMANEGRVSLSGKDVACEGVSLWRGGSYRVSGRCQGLVYPYTTKQDHYVLWAKTLKNGEIVRVGEVKSGYWDGNVSDDFESVYITAETKALPRQPSSTQVVSGKVIKFEFGGSGVVAEPMSTPKAETLMQDKTETMTVQTGSKTTQVASSSVGSVVGKIFKSLLIIIVVVIGLVIGTSLIFRKRGSIND